MSMPSPPPTTQGTAAALPTAGWTRLSSRIIWVDLLLSILSLLPAVVAVGVLGADATGGQIWPLLGIAAFGVLSAIADMTRWMVTRFRITPTHVELTTGIVQRRHRSIRRERIRSVDIEAKLRHRVARMRVVNVGAGQQSAAGEAALSLDALRAEDARALQAALLDEVGDPPPAAEDVRDGQLPAREDPPGPSDGQPVEQPAAAADAGRTLRVFARFEPSWFIYNMFNIWAYVLALGLGWGALWLLGTIGIDLYGFVAGLLDWQSIGWLGTALIAVVAGGALGAVGLGIVYVIENWNLELARVRGKDGTMLRTRKGLFTTREIHRDENRIRGAQISQPLLWRWMGVSDTRVITTGLDEWSTSEPAAILPRGPVRRAREVAGQVLGDAENPFHVPLSPHPVAARRRRLRWATALSLGVAAILTGLAIAGVIPYGAIWAAVAFWPVSLLAGVIAYRALGHTLTERYVITRSGLMNRATTVLQRSAVSTIVISESLLQRRLGLRSVSTMTAAGDGGYDTPDLERQAALEFAVQAAPGLLDDFLVPAAGREQERER